MIHLTVPKWVKKHCIDFTQLDYKPNSTRPLTGKQASTIGMIRFGLQRFNNPKHPEVSIVIPAYNEEKDLLRTLSSIANIKTNFETELIVANNKSTDNTQAILDLCRVSTVYETEQGISYARQAGLEKARGKYIISGDADTIYPATWVDALIPSLKNPKVACVYGNYSFIPSKGNKRVGLAVHELGTWSVIQMRRYNRSFVNVMGCNNAFRKADAVDVGGYEHNLRRSETERGEDGWMGYLLSKKGLIKRIGGDHAKAWTSDRRLLEAGSLPKAFAIRLKKHVGKVGSYLRPFEHGS